MKLYKLKVHTRDFSPEDLVLNPKDFPDIKVDDVLEIYHQEEKFSRLLLQVSEKSMNKDLQQNTISVDQGIATNFHLRKYDDVIVDVVDPLSVALDSLELTFKDQYLERSDMWRLKKNLENTCVYLDKKVELWLIRCNVYEMWSQGERVACGVVTENTKIVFRSSTNLIYLFVQMSSEMWDMDINGDLYFEKAINGFLSDLFAKWKENDTSHEVTIVLFSRTFYEAQNIEEFPDYMHSCLQKDYKGRFYEDFYRVAVQNERYEDWTVILVYLKKLFNSYRETVLQFHNRPGVVIPRAINSTAAQGNFLEVLNMSLNVFEKHYQDRSFDRTGHLSVVITPGVGVFEVDRELTNITKQRIIDNGVGSDLVCLGEQPLHAVPLFKFHSKSNLNTVDDYSMPHWTNLSFYSSSKQTTNSNFIPRIKLPPKKSKPAKEKLKATDLLPARSKSVIKEEFPNLPVVDYDEYDAQVFKHAIPGAHNARNSNSLQRAVVRKRSENYPFNNQQRHIIHQRKYSEADITQIHVDPNKSLSKSAAVSIPRRPLEYSPLSSSLGIFNPDDRMTPTSVLESYDEDNSPPIRAIVGSAGSPYTFPHAKTSSVRPGRALINPFDPSHVTIKLTSNRRRWTHVFPLGPTGIFMQQHHYQAVPHTTGNSDDLENMAPTQKVLHAGQLVVEARRRKTSSMSIHPNEVSSRAKGTTSRSLMQSTELSTEKSLTLIWGATGEQEWTPALTTGVDWKSCTIPACLPLTTDYFPDRRSLQNDYVVSDYDLIPEYMTCDVSHRNNNRTPLTTKEVFCELVCQRLQQGFQLIVNPATCKFGLGRVPHPQSVSSPLQPFLRPVPQVEEPKEEYFLSIGRIFHKLTLVGSTITVTCLKPRHPYPTINIKYLYRFMAQHSETYEVSPVDFNTEKLENFNWNYLDHYICSRGEGDFTLTESLKYSRFRMFALPLASTGTKRILEGSQYCDVYDELTADEELLLAAEFLHFLNVLNKIRKPHHSRKNRERQEPVVRPTANTRRGNLVAQANLPQAGVSYLPGVGQGVGSGVVPHRERLDSNSSLARPRSRNNAKNVERMRSESGNGGRGTANAAAEISEYKPISSSCLTLDGETDTFFGIHKDGSEESTSPQSSTPRRLTHSSSLVDIIESMKHPQDGLSFLTKTPGLPNMSFISAEATAWVMQHIDGSGTLEKACILLDKLLLEDYICHCSGNPSHPFIHGFFFYYICPTDKELSDGNMYYALGDVESFQREWIEVAFHVRKNPYNKRGPLFLQSDLPWPKHFTREDGTVETGSKRKYNVSLFKNTNIEIINNKCELTNKNCRDEWGHIKYHGNYSPSAAFELVLQWLVATGSFVTDLVLKHWARRANFYGLLLVPVHSDPFAQPFSNQFDPLRGTIFIPLAVHLLMDDKSHPFAVFPSESWDYRLFLFQEAIVRRFGFLPCQYSHFMFDPHDSGSRHQQCQPQYVHTTGNAMLMIPIKLREILNRKLQNDSNKSKFLSANMDGNIISSPHEEYITRHVTGQVNRKSLQLQDADCRVGFLWSWNYTLSKRWKCNSTGDDQFMFKILNDFRAFCANADNRLRRFWDGCKQEMLEAMQSDQIHPNFADDKKL